MRSKAAVRIAALMVAATLVAAADPGAAATAKKPPASASAKAKPAKKPSGIWRIGRDEEGLTLEYRVPGDTVPTLTAICRPDAALFQIVAEVSPPKARSGDAVKLVLANGRVAVEFAASVFPSALDGRRAVEAQVSLESKLVELFKEADQLRIIVPGASQSLPLAGVQRYMADFEKRCLGPTTPARGTRSQRG